MSKMNSKLVKKYHLLVPSWVGGLRAGGGGRHLFFANAKKAPTSWIRHYDTWNQLAMSSVWWIIKSFLFIKGVSFNVLNPTLDKSSKGQTPCRKSHSLLQTYIT